MKFSKIKRISPSEVARITISLADICNNGHDGFGYSCDIFTLNGHKDEAKLLYEGKIYRESGGDRSKEFMLQHFVEFEPIFKLDGCDIFGLPVYPLMNGAHWLEKNPEYAKEEFRLTDSEVETLRNYKPLSLAKFWDKMTKTRYKKEVSEAIKLLESLTNEKYKITESVSPHLYNDIHYVFITEAKGWNIHKGEKNKNKLQYHLDLSK